MELEVGRPPCFGQIVFVMVDEDTNPQESDPGPDDRRVDIGLAVNPGVCGRLHVQGPVGPQGHPGPMDLFLKRIDKRFRHHAPSDGQYFRQCLLRFVNFGHPFRQEATV